MVACEIAVTKQLPLTHHQPGSNSPKASQCAQDERVAAGCVQTGAARLGGIVRNKKASQIKEGGGHYQGDRKMGGATVHFSPKSAAHNYLPSESLVQINGESTTASVLLPST